MHARRATLVLLLAPLACGDSPRGGEMRSSDDGAGIGEISLRRRWPRSMDTLQLTFERDGGARADGGAPAWPVRCPAKGRLAAGEFDELAAILAGIDRAALGGLSAPRGGLAGSLSVAWHEGDGEVRLECATGDAPPALAAAALAIEAIGRRVDWRSAEPGNASALPAEVPERYAFLLEPLGGPGDPDLMPYERIELERSECFGPCPSYRVSFSRDGAATWEGRANTAPEGRNVGKVGVRDFARIAWLSEVLGVESFAGEYRFAATDFQTTTLRLVRRDGSVVKILDYGGRAPIQVQALFDEIDFTASRVAWLPEAGGR